MHTTHYCQTVMKLSIMLSRHLLFLWRWFPAGLQDTWNALDWNLADTVTEARQARVDFPQLLPFPLCQLTYDLTHTTPMSQLLDTLSEIFLVHVLELGRHRRHSLILLHQPYTCFGCKIMAAVYGVLCGGPNNLSCLKNNLSTLSTDADQ